MVVVVVVGELLANGLSGLRGIAEARPAVSKSAEWQPVRESIRFESEYGIAS